ncbi:hypothetical protein Tco_0346188 [Tanacetum coccineum]
MQIMGMVGTMDFLTRGSWLVIPRVYDGKGGAIALTRWIEKIKSMIDNNGCSGKGREAAVGMTWVEFKALLVE